MTKGRLLTLAVVSLLLMTSLGLLAGGVESRQRAKEASTQELRIATTPAEEAHRHYDLGQQEAARGHWQQAVLHFQQAVEIDPGYAAAYRAMGRVYREHHQWEKALASYSRAVALEPKHIEAYYYRATSYLALRRYAEAAADFSRVIEAQPRHSSAYLGRAVSYWLMGRCLWAAQDLKAFMALNPGELPPGWTTEYATILEGVARCHSPLPESGDTPALTSAFVVPRSDRPGRRLPASQSQAGLSTDVTL